ncbi:MAG: polyprenyl synthetase [Bacteroidia bacterium]|nr:MAG: polyprenyl synthetase [Bacteroidia bacterium]
MSIIHKIAAPIKEDMKKFETYFQTSLNTPIKLLDIIVNYIFRRKGKQMRPMLVFLSAKLFGDINSSTYNAATFIELLHTATLIHDDVVDDAYERRGFFSIKALWRSKIAVLVGDFMLAKGMLLAIERDEYELLKIISNTVKEMSEGELLQLEKSRQLNITEEIYFEIIRKKTATLLASCTSSGAKSVGCEDTTVEKMRLMGEYIGIAFQIKDDILDYSQNNKIGKPIANDIKEKKLTLPLLYVLNKASKSEKKKILRTVRVHNKNRKKVNELVNFVRENGGIAYAESKMNEYKNMALNILRDFPDNQAKESLRNFIEYTSTRKK